jgi:hypothetical protein
MTQKNAWSMPAINLAGISLFEEFDTIVSGYYACVVLDSEDFTSKGDSGSNGASQFPGAPGAPAQASSQATSVLFRVKINEQASPENGKVASAWIGREPKEGNLRRWKALYASCGYPLPSLEQAVTPHPSHFLGKQCFIHYIAPPVAENQKVQAKDISINFITQDQYMEHKRQEQQAPKGFGVASAAPSMPGAVAPAPISFGGPNGQPAQQPQYQPQQYQPQQYQPQQQQQQPQPQQYQQPQQQQPPQGYAPAPMAAAPPPPGMQPVTQAQPIAPAPPLTAPTPPGYGASPNTLYETPPQGQQMQQPPSAFAPPQAPGAPAPANVVPIYQQQPPQGPPQPAPGSTLFGPPPTA